MNPKLQISISILLATALLWGCGDDASPSDPDAGTMDDGGDPMTDGGDVDITAPVVVATVPTDGAAEVDPGTSIRIVFSEAIDVAAGGSIVVAHDGTTLDLGAPSFTSDARELTVSPAAELPTNASIDVTADGFRDAAGNEMTAPHTFSFSTSDPIAPTVTSTSPAEGATDVAPTLDAIAFDFSEPMNVALGAATLSGGPGTLGPATWEGTRATFAVSGLAPDTGYRVELAGFADPAGNALDGTVYLGDGALDFTTGSDTTAPVVTESSPSEGATGVPPTRTTRVRIVFSEPMDPSAGTAELDLDGTPTALEASWAGAGTILLLDVTGLFEADSTYSITLTGFTDAAGNALDGAVYLGDGALDFSTGGDELPPFVLYSNPAEMATGVRWTTSTVFVTFSEPMDTTIATVPFDDGVASSTFDASWSSGGALLEIDVAGRLISGRTYVLDFTAFVDATGTPIDTTHAYLGDGRLTFTMAAPEGENCQDYLTTAEATASGGTYTWTIAATQVANVDGAAPCDTSGGSADALVRYTKTSPDSTDIGGAGSVLRVTVTSSSTVTDKNLNVDVLRDACDPTSSTASRLTCRTGDNPHSFDLDVGPGDYYVWIAASTGAFRGATVVIEEIPASVGDTCANAITISPGTTAITPTGTQSIDAPSCMAGALTWYRYTASQRLGLVTVAAPRAVGGVDAASGQHLVCRTDATTVPVPLVAEVGDDVCFAVASGSATSVTLTERPYTGVRGVPTDLEVTYPSGTLGAPATPFIGVTPSRVYVSSNMFYLQAPRTGGVEVTRVTSPPRVPGETGVMIGEAYYTVARGTFSTTSPQPMILQMIDATGAPLDPPVPIDTTQPYVATTEMAGIVVDGTNFLFVQGNGTLTTAAHFYSVPIAGGPVTHLGTNDQLHSVSALAVDDTYVYVISRAFGGDQSSEGIYRLRRDELSNPAATPVLVYGGGHNWNDSSGGLFLERSGTTQWLYFRTYNPGDVHLLLDPESATPTYVGPIWTTTTNNQTGLGYDPATPALFLIDHANGDAWVRLD